MLEKKCPQCGKVFPKPENISNRRFEQRLYCSNLCSSKNKVRNRGSNNPSWKGGKINKVCVICHETFQAWPYKKNTQKCCGTKCLKKYQRTLDFIEPLRQKRLGKTLSEETKQKLSDVQKGKRTGSENSSWKGNEVGYRALHDWIRKELGSPDKCEHCSLGIAEHKRLVWANKSHQYLRDVNDWMRLCYRCHRIYDFPNEKHP